VRKLLALMLCIQVCLAGCALRSGGRSSANQRGERLALEPPLAYYRAEVARTLVSELVKRFMAGNSRPAQ
jgi:hypothetical protein